MMTGTIRLTAHHPKPGDCIRLDREHHTQVGDEIWPCPGKAGQPPRFRVLDECGVELVIERSADDDTDQRRGWRLAFPQSWH